MPLNKGTKPIPHETLINHSYLIKLKLLPIVWIVEFEVEEYLTLKK